MHKVKHFRIIFGAKKSWKPRSSWVDQKMLFDWNSSRQCSKNWNSFKETAVTLNSLKYLQIASSTITPFLSMISFPINVSSLFGFWTLFAWTFKNFQVFLIVTVFFFYLNPVFYYLKLKKLLRCEMHSNFSLAQLRLLKCSWFDENPTSKWACCNRQHSKLHKIYGTNRICFGLWAVELFER